MCGGSVCDLETSIMRGSGPKLGYSVTGKEGGKFTNVENLRLLNITLHISCSGSLLKQHWSGDYCSLAL
jgi:hypothetical protein